MSVVRLDFGAADWETPAAKGCDARRTTEAAAVDRLLFVSEGLYYKKIPEFVIGRPGWDNWLLWYPLSERVPVVDASDAVVAVHQNHDYAYHPDGEKGVWEGEEARENYQLHKREIPDASECEESPGPT